MRKKKRGGHANHERWLVSYADFITLLFAFFVVMFSSSQVDKRKVGKLAMAMQVAFEKFSLLQSSNLRPPVTKDMAPYDHIRNVEQSIRTNELKIPIPGTKPAEVPKPADMNELAKDLDKALRLQIVKHEIAVKQGREGVIISLREIGFFESGQAGVKLQAEPALEQIAGFLRTVTNYVRIEGHTDNQPLHPGGRFASNWDLSAARATDMLNLFIDRYHIEPHRLSVGGYAEFHPLASNETPEGRAQNRRVDIVVLNNFTR